MKLSTAIRKDIPEKKKKRCIKKFLYYFPKGFSDQKYIDWERNYKWDAHLRFKEELNETKFAAMLKMHAYEDICQLAVKTESATNLLFSFEKMALRDAVKQMPGAKTFAIGLYDYIYGSNALSERFKRFTEVIASLPRKQTRVLTWPLHTVFGFIGNPDEHIFLKPRVTQAGAEKYGYDLGYTSKPNWETYQSMLGFAEQLYNDLKDLKPRDMIDIQSFIWVMGSEEYPD